jgi:hypothetical protein
MAGHIHISEAVGLSLGGLQYEHMIELIREQLIARNGTAFIAQIYHGNDELA